MSSGKLAPPEKRNPIHLPDYGIDHPHTINLKTVINHPRIEIGDYTYYNDLDLVEDHAKKLAPYLYPNSREKLIIGKFVQIAYGVQFLTSSANHQMHGISTFPFSSMLGRFDEALTIFADKGDTIIGNDVWIGHEAVIMPGVKIGSGAIIGTRAVVTKDVEPYTIVAGNPAKVLKRRYSKEDIEELLSIAWWDWDVSEIEKHVDVLLHGTVAQLMEIAKEIVKN